MSGPHSPANYTVINGEWLEMRDETPRREIYDTLFVHERFWWEIWISSFYDPDFRRRTSFSRFFWKFIQKIWRLSAMTKFSNNPFCNFEKVRRFVGYLV